MAIFIEKFLTLGRSSSCTISSHKDGVMKERTVNKLKKTMAKDLAELARRYPAPQADQPAVQPDENNNAGEDN